ncbi:stage II sporulation protein B [Anoxybacillus flavithermus]|uniref:Stage II sporulation protein B n=1 Tax=Anoxybacillus flavithermus TaxID=33934 RepID=A0A2G5RQ38_9BACL|nr:MULTISPECIES: SPOR domain-containing protein [Anoxybacillus]KFZ42484.1 stage II sporulation protein B [Anoxybacillus sp. KU2-6(11)]PIC04802.1 stage II sporulation protein B [Anoxybacillus flavithermus]
MDKPAKKAIVIKVNGKEQPYTSVTNTLPQWSSEESNEQSEKQDEFIPFETSKRYEKRSPWRSFLFAIALAVVLGTSFGLLVLKVIPATESKPTSTAPLQQEQKEELPTAKRTETIFVIQGGVFQDEKAANVYVQKIKTQQRPSVMIGKQPVYVFLGMALTKEEAKQMASLYEPLGIDTYVKAWNISIDEKESEPFVMILFVISRLLNGQQLQNEQWKQLQSYSPHNEQMKKAYEALFAFRQTNDQAQLWAAQQHILNVLQ